MAAALDIVGVFEASEILGLKPASFSHLRARSRSIEGTSFPPAAAELRMGPVWHRKDIERFAKNYRSVKKAVNGKAVNSKEPAAVNGSGEKSAPKKTSAAVAKKIATKKLIVAK